MRVRTRGRDLDNVNSYATNVLYKDLPYSYDKIYLS